MLSPSLRPRTERPLSPSLVNPEPRPRKVARRGTLEAVFQGAPIRDSIVYLSKPDPLPAAPGKKYVVDLFCGIGGFSQGASESGHSVVLAVDFDKVLLQCHLENHKMTRHLIMRLGPDTEDSLMQEIQTAVPHGQPWHLHGSPPCTKLSTLQGSMRQKAGRSYDDDTEEGMRLVTWYLSLVVRLRPTSWSFEQVPMPEICGALRIMKTLYPSIVDFCKRVHFKDYGVGQGRIRTIAGSPSLIASLLHTPSLRLSAPTIAEMLDPPAQAALVQSRAGKVANPTRTVRHADGSYTNDSIFHDCYRRLTRVAFTCLAKGPSYWARADFTIIRKFTTRECATIQSFPPEFILPTKEAIAHIGIGNAVPPRFARQLMSA